MTPNYANAALVVGSGMRALAMLSLVVVMSARATRADTALVTVPFTLATPAVSAPGQNHLRLVMDLSALSLGSQTDTARLYGHGSVLMALDTSDPNAPVLLGFSLQSSAFSVEDTAFNFVAPPFANISISATGLHATVAASSIDLTPVSGTTFAASNHVILIDQGGVSASGSMGGGPVNGFHDLAAAPVTGEGAGAGTMLSSFQPTSPTLADYDFSVTIPFALADTLTVSGILMRVRVTGSLTATGSVSIATMPTIDAVDFSSSGVWFRVEGNTGAVVALEVSTNLIEWSTLRDVTLDTSPLTFPDAGDPDAPQRYYRLNLP